MRRRLIYGLVTVALALNLMIGARIYQESAHAAGKQDAVYPNLELFANVLEKVRKEYVDGQSLTYHDLVYSALKGMVGSLDADQRADHALERRVNQVVIRQILAVHIFLAHLFQHVGEQLQIRIHRVLFARRVRRPQINPRANRQIQHQRHNHQTINQTSSHKRGKTTTKASGHQIFGNGLCRGGSKSNFTFQQRLNERQIARHRDFRIRRHAGHQPDRLANQFTRRRVVGENQFAAARFRQRPANHLDPERLGRLHRPKPRPVERALNESAVAGFLDGVRYRLGRHRGAVFIRRLDRCGDQFPARAGARRILNGHNFRRHRQRLQPVPDRILPFRPANDDPKWFLKMKFCREFREVLFPSRARTTRMISPMHFASSNRCQVCATTGRPATSRNNLSTPAPMRMPLPAATRMAAFMQ